MIKETKAHNSKITLCLSSHNIEYQVDADTQVIAVNRTSMVQKMSDGDDQSGYDKTRKMLKELLGDNVYLMWGCRDDENMYLVVYDMENKNV